MTTESLRVTGAPPARSVPGAPPRSELAARRRSATFAAGGDPQARARKIFRFYILVTLAVSATSGAIGWFAEAKDPGAAVALAVALLLTLGVGYGVGHRLDRLFQQRMAVTLERDRLFELSRDPIAIVAADGTIRQANLAFDAKCGAIGSDHDRFLEHSVEADRALVADVLARLWQHGDSQTFEARSRAIDGAERTISWSLALEPSAKVAYLVGQDVTDRKQADAALRRSEMRFQLAARATNETLWEWTVTSGEVWWNDAFFRWSGFPAAGFDHTIHGRWALVHPEDRERVQRGFEACLASGDSVWRDEYRLRRADDSYAWVQDRAYAVRAADEAVTQMIGAMVDITARKEAEHMKADFVSFVSHQLRTPIAGISWMLELAADAPGLPEEIASYVSEARASAARLASLVNDLLDIARIESGRLAVEVTAVPLQELAASVLDELRPIADAKHHLVERELALPTAVVEADVQLLRQAITNLMSNAIKYTPEGGEIHVAVRRCPEGVLFQVKDSGIGVPKRAQARLFEKFYRAENAVALETEGTGLGLHLVRLIVEQFGGRVWCESEPGQGATFGFQLPAAGGS